MNGIRRSILSNVLLLVLMTVLAAPVVSHPPSDMLLEYDLDSSILNVTITHGVSDPEDHYIEKVRVEIDDAHIFTEDYDNQSTTGTFTLSYTLNASVGDNISVEAECNKYGELIEHLTVEANGSSGNGSGGGGSGGNATLDGKITSGEYDHKASFGGGDLVIHWKVQGSTIQMALVGKTTGWVSIGLDPSTAMEDADMILGWVDEDGAHVKDQFSTGPYGPHKDDTKLGGTDDIDEFGGSEDGGFTTIEVVRDLDTGDTNDKVIPVDGPIDIIWAMGDSDDPSMIHEFSGRGSGVINFATGRSSEEDDRELWPTHAVLMGTGTAIALVGIIIAIFFRKRPWWLKAHMSFGITGASMVLTGLLVAIYMVEDSGAEHFRVTHGRLGLITGILTLATVCMGYNGVKRKSRKLRTAHKWVAKLTMVLLIMAVMGGLNQAGVT